MMENALHFILKALFVVLDMFTFLTDFLFCRKTA